MGENEDTDTELEEFLRDAYAVLRDAPFDTDKLRRIAGRTDDEYGWSTAVDPEITRLAAWLERRFPRTPGRRASGLTKWLVAHEDRPAAGLVLIRHGGWSNTKHWRVVWSLECAQAAVERRKR